MADEPAVAPSGHGEHRLELRKEAFTMALYVSICLLAGLLALPERAAEHTSMLGVVWGITLGLAIAHWFAFRVSARLVGAGAVRQADVESAGAQLLGAAVVAVLASLGVLLLPTSVELEFVEFLLAGFIALVGFAVARGGGASRFKAVVYATTVLVAALLIALLKNVLAGH